MSMATAMWRRCMDVCLARAGGKMTDEKIIVSSEHILDILESRLEV